MNRTLRRLAVAVLGGAIVLLGLVMVIAPGPGLVLVPAGLGVLALEFDSAGRLQRRLFEFWSRMASRWRGPSG